MKNARNVPIVQGWDAPSRDEIMSLVKKSSVFESILMCMNIDIRKTRLESYISQHRINQNQHVLMERVSQILPPEQCPPPSPELTTESDGTLSFTTWNQGGLMNWKELQEITSGPSRNTDKAPMEEDDEDYDGSATHNGSYDEEEEEEDSE
jgi:hypothetical protein